MTQHQLRSASTGGVGFSQPTFSLCVCVVLLQDAAGNTLLHTAMGGKNDVPGLVSALVEAGVAVNTANKEQDTALHIAARQGHLEVISSMTSARQAFVSGRRLAAVKAASACCVHMQNLRRSNLQGI